MEKIELRKVRDFGALFNDSVAFLRRNFKPYFGSILYLAGPFIIFTGLISGYMQSLQSQLMESSWLRGFGLGSSAGLFSANFFGTLSIFILISILTTLVTTACICLYFKEYDKTNEAELPVTRTSISSQVASACWRLFYNFLIMVLVVGAATLVIAAIFGVLFLVPALNVIAGIFLVIGVIIILPVFIYVLYTANYVIIRDEVLFPEALAKTWRYVKGNFWWTWLLIVAAGLSVATVASIFNIPLTIITFMRTFTRMSDPTAAEAASGGNLMIIIFGALSVVGQLLVVSPVFYTFCIMNFHSQEEQHEGRGLMNRIDELDS